MTRSQIFPAPGDGLGPKTRHFSKTSLCISSREDFWKKGVKPVIPVTRMVIHPNLVMPLLPAPKELQMKKNTAPSTTRTAHPPIRKGVGISRDLVPFDRPGSSALLPAKSRVFVGGKEER